MSILNGLKEFLINAMNTVLFFLPDSPFSQFLNATMDNELLAFINWILPIGTFISIGQVWLSAISVFYIYQLILRWIKAIE